MLDILYESDYFIIDKYGTVKLTEKLKNEINNGLWEVKPLPKLPKYGLYLINLFDGLECKYLNLSNWDVSNVREIKALCVDCNNLVSVDMTGWNINITNPFRVFNLFVRCPNLNGECIPNYVLNKIYRTAPLKSVKEINISENDSIIENNKNSLDAKHYLFKCIVGENNPCYYYIPGLLAIPKLEEIFLDDYDKILYSPKNSFES